MRILCNILVLFFVTTAAVGQQINPVPDYIFRNQMSVGRNIATDTAAYMSIGPRFGATKGFMPPMVVDTNAVTGTKRNGLLIFSVQLNNFAYWDSTTSRFRKITAEAIVDSLLYSTRAWRQKGDDSVAALVAAKVNISDTATMLTPYLRKADTTSMLNPYVRIAGYGLTKGTQTLSVDTGLMATRLRVQKAIDSLAATEIDGSGTVNRVAKFTASGTVGNGSIADSSSSVRMTILSGGNIGIGTTTPNATEWNANARVVHAYQNSTNGALFKAESSSTSMIFSAGGGAGQFGTSTNHPLTFLTNVTERMRLTAAGRLLVGTTTEGTNTVDIAGTLRSTQGANFATDGATNVGIGTISPSERLHVNRAVAGDVAALVSNTVSSNYFMTRSTGNLDFITTAGAIQFSPNVTERMRLTTGGLLGIGTTTPQFRQQVVSTGSTAATIVSSFGISGGTGGTGAAIAFTSEGDNTGTSKVGIGNVRTAGWDVSALAFYANNSQTQGNFTSADERMRITPTGLVGIGTTSPSEALHVVGRGRFTTIDSTSSPINLLTSDVNGVIRKTSIAASGGVTGSGTASRIPVFTSSTAIGNSNIYVSANGAGFGLNDANPTQITNYGILNLGGSAGSVQYFKIADTIRGYFGMAAQTIGQPYTTSVLEITNSTSGDIRFTTASSEKVRLKNDGELVLGSVSTDAGNYRLQVNGSQYVSSSMNIANATVFDANNKLEIYGPAFIRNTAAAGVFRFDSTAANFVSVENRAVISISGGSHTGSNGGAVLSIEHTWNTSGDVNLIRADVTNTASGSLSNFIRLSDGTNTFRVNKSAEIFTSAPTGGSSKGWRLGDVSVVSPTSPNRTLRVEVDGTVYYIHAKTTND